MRKEHLEIIEKKKHLMNANDVTIIETRKCVLGDLDQLEKLLKITAQKFDENKCTLEMMIKDKHRVLYSFSGKCSGHIWDKDEPDSMGRGKCVICGYDDY
jgi:hypothetical protein